MLSNSVEGSTGRRCRLKATDSAHLLHLRHVRVPRVPTPEPLELPARGHNCLCATLLIYAYVYGWIGCSRLMIEAMAAAKTKDTDAHYTTFIRVPIPRGDFVEPPLVCIQKPRRQRAPADDYHR